MSIRCREVNFVPMCTPKRGSPWFAVEFTRHTQREARTSFVAQCAASTEDWESFKREGWRIVRVEMLS